MSIKLTQIMKNGGEVALSGVSELKAEIRCSEGVEKIVIESDSEKFIHISWENVIKDFILYVPDGRFEFAIPEGQATRGFEPGIFEKDNSMEIRVATADELKEYRNLCLNPLDYRVSEEVVDPDAPEWANPTDSKAVADGLIKAFPHAYANRVTRNEGSFYARNAIDGMAVSGGHGSYPYHSWGGAVHEDLTLAIYFGREVSADKLGLCLRSDYNKYIGDLEHDTYWHTARIELSDGFATEINPVKTADTQYFDLGEHKTTYLKLSRLDPLQHDKSENFAALNQIEIWGRDM